jgi:DNA primase
MSIPQHTIDQILDRIDLVDLINARVKLKKSGKTYTACCPFHEEKTPSFHVDGQKGFYHCFGCQAKGNAIRFLMDYENRQFIDVIQDLAQQAGIELPKNRQEDQNKFVYKKTAPQINKATQQPPNTSAASTVELIPDYMDIPYDQLDSDYFSQGFDEQALFADFNQPAPEDDGNLYDLLEQVAQFYQQQLPQSSSASRYIGNRGLDQKAVEYWRLGYAPDGWQHLAQRFPQDIDGLKTVGLIRQSDNGRDYDLLRDRLIFPIRDHKGRVVGFGGRALNDDIKPKYINSPESIVFQKSQILYGLFEGRKANASGVCGVCG